MILNEKNTHFVFFPVESADYQIGNNFCLQSCKMLYSLVVLAHLISRICESVKLINVHDNILLSWHIYLEEDEE